MCVCVYVQLYIMWVMEKLYTKNKKEEKKTNCKYYYYFIISLTVSYAKK